MTAANTRGASERGHRPRHRPRHSLPHVSRHVIDTWPDPNQVFIAWCVTFLSARSVCSIIYRLQICLPNVGARHYADAAAVAAAATGVRGASRQLKPSLGRWIGQWTFSARDLLEKVLREKEVVFSPCATNRRGKGVCLPAMLSIARCSLNEPPHGTSLFFLFFSLCSNAPCVSPLSSPDITWTSPNVT